MHGPKSVAQAGELRDRYLEEVNERGLPSEAWGEGKYNVCLLIADDIRVKPEEVGCSMRHDA